mmetsp:Transcript_2566/g.3885  ORF Transcript_2566/g.3885 Transcript_2566/m.3885 type:complete len:240 (-) Transcript_2566:1099-1818(-)
MSSRTCPIVLPSVSLNPRVVFPLTPSLIWPQPRSRKWPRLHLVTWSWKRRRCQRKRKIKLLTWKLLLPSPPPWLPWLRLLVRPFRLLFLPSRQKRLPSPLMSTKFLLGLQVSPSPPFPLPFLLPLPAAAALSPQPLLGPRRKRMMKMMTSSLWMKMIPKRKRKTMIRKPRKPMKFHVLVIGILISLLSSLLHAVPAAGASTPTKTKKLRMVSLFMRRSLLIMSRLVCRVALRVALLRSK